MKLLPFLEPIRDDLARVEERLLRASDVEYSLLRTAMKDLLTAGGKRLRPAVAILASQFYDAPQEKVTSLAAAVEMLHTATLVHDDMIDRASTRRGHPTLNSRWSSEATILTGDYMFAVSAALAAETESVPVVQIFAQALMTICNGELHQLLSNKEWPPSREVYYQRIYSKTASLFAAAAEAGATLSAATPEQVQQIRSWGRYLGMAFQIVDDVLDFTGDTSKLGKPVGSDLRQGVVTLPVLCYVEAEPDPEFVEQIRQVAAGESDGAEAVIERIVSSGAAEKALREAAVLAHQGQEALDGLPDGQSKRLVQQLSEYVVARRI